MIHRLLLRITASFDLRAGGVAQSTQSRNGMHVRHALLTNVGATFRPFSSSRAHHSAAVRDEITGGFARARCVQHKEGPDA